MTTLRRNQTSGNKHRAAMMKGISRGSSTERVQDELVAVTDSPMPLKTDARESRLAAEIYVPPPLTAISRSAASL
jgi:hypothetical protein